MKLKDISPVLIEGFGGDYERSDADADGGRDDFVEWVNNTVVGSANYPTVYNILDQADVDEDPWMAIDAAFPQGKSEDWVVRGEDAKAFLALAVRQPEEAIQQYAMSISELYDDSDLQDTYNDEVEYRRGGADRYFNAHR